jgi:cytoskeletal protein CcmA (bactofilin family)
MFGINSKGHISELVGYAGFYLGPEVIANGTIKTEEDVYIDGKFKGSIETQGAVELGKNSIISGSVAGRSIIVDGQVKADLKAVENIQVAGCGQLGGTAEARNINIDSGAILSAKIKTTQ